MDSPTTLGARQELIVGKPVYDLAGRLVAVKQYNGTAQTDNDILTEFTYTYADKTNYLTEKTMDLPTREMTATYTYGDAAVGEMPDQVYNVYYDSWSSVDYAYDPLGRLTDETFHVAAGYTIDNAYTYLDVNADRTTTLVSSYSTKTGTYAYTYDNVGNITQIVFTPADTTQSAKTITYQYDNLNRLIRENNEIAGKTWFYYYSGIGNICDVQESPYTPASSFPAVRTEVRSHTYGDSTWRDRLTEFNGNTITYDNIGNPTAIGSTNLTWEGRSLVGYADGANTYSYEYDMSGHRISKTVNGTKTEYFYDGDQLVAQQSGNDRITFMFDANGSAFGFYYNNAPYFFIKNIQGDVTAITNFAGTVIGTYTYDAWGNLIPEASDLSDEVAAMNPIRYRGYYYDAETGYYFLNTRYYSAEMGRFISADSSSLVIIAPISLTDKNLFSYCDNNPITRVDPAGNSWTAILGAMAISGVAGAVIDTVSYAIECKFFNTDFSWKSAVVNAVSGFVNGAVALSPLPTTAKSALGVAISGATYIVEQVVNDEAIKIGELIGGLIVDVIWDYVIDIGDPGKIVSDTIKIADNKIDDMLGRVNTEYAQKQINSTIKWRNNIITTTSLYTVTTAFVSGMNIIISTVYDGIKQLFQDIVDIFR